MNLRQGQLDALSEPQRREFEEFMVAHLQKWFPDECSALGDEGMRLRIRTGMARAEPYGLVGRRDVCKFIDVSFVLGPKFDQDPALPWAARILAARDLDPSAKADQLVAAALEQRRLQRE